MSRGVDIASVVAFWQLRDRLRQLHVLRTTFCVICVSQMRQNSLKCFACFISRGKIISGVKVQKARFRLWRKVWRENVHSKITDSKLNISEHVFFGYTQSWPMTINHFTRSDPSRP